MAESIISAAMAVMRDWLAVVIAFFGCMGEIAVGIGKCIVKPFKLLGRFVAEDFGGAAPAQPGGVYIYFPDELFRNISDHIDVEQPRGVPGFVFLVVHEEVGQDGNLLESEIVGVYLNRYSANLRVLGFTAAFVLPELHHLHARAFADLDGASWEVTQDGIASVQYISTVAPNNTHDVYTHAVPLNTTGGGGRHIISHLDQVGVYV